MVHEEIQTLHEPDGSPVCNVSFDLSAAQLAAASHALAEVLVERHRGLELDIDDVLALRELTALRDEIDRVAAAEANATLLLTLARLIVLHDVLDEYVISRRGRDWNRKVDEDALPILAALLDPLASLRARAVAEVLGAAQPSSS